MERVTGAQRRRDNSIWERGYGEDFAKKCKLRGKGCLLIRGRGSREPLKCMAQAGKQEGREFTV